VATHQILLRNVFGVVEMLFVARIRQYLVDLVAVVYG